VRERRFFALAVITLLMHSPSGLIIVILVFTAVLAAGCTQGTGPAAPATPVPVPGPGLQDLALKPSEIPACFSLTDQHTKSSGDVGQLAKDLGWQAGYEVMYTCPATGAEPTILVQSLAVYPAANMPGLASMVDKQDRSAGFSYEDLTFPGQGSTMNGFYGKAGSAGVPGSPEDTGHLTGTGSVPETNVVPGSDVAEVIFSKGTRFSVLKMTGPGTNATVVRDLALVAYAKLP
jgi:hypothetical protein